MKNKMDIQEDYLDEAYDRMKDDEYTMKDEENGNY